MMMIQAEKDGLQEEEVAVGTIFNVFSYDGVWVSHGTYHLPNPEQIRNGYATDAGSWHLLYRVTSDTKNIFLTVCMIAALPKMTI